MGSADRKAADAQAVDPLVVVGPIERYGYKKLWAQQKSRDRPKTFPRKKRERANVKSEGGEVGGGYIKMCMALSLSLCGDYLDFY